MAIGGMGAARWMWRGSLTALGLAVLGATALAAPASPGGKPLSGAKAETTGSVKQVAEAAPEAAVDAPGCSKARRRLWVEGEGWIVRRITTCH